MNEPVVITGDAILVARVLAIRSGMILKIDTGMQHSRVSMIKVAQRSGLTTRATYRGALRDVNKWLTDQGVPARWSKTYPDDGS